MSKHPASPPWPRASLQPSTPPANAADSASASTTARTAPPPPAGSCASAPVDVRPGEHSVRSAGAGSHPPPARRPCAVHHQSPDGSRPRPNPAVASGAVAADQDGGEASGHRQRSTGLSTTIQRHPQQQPHPPPGSAAPDAGSAALWCPKRVSGTRHQEQPTDPVQSEAVGVQPPEGNRLSGWSSTGQSSLTPPITSSSICTTSASNCRRALISTSMATPSVVPMSTQQRPHSA